MSLSALQNFFDQEQKYVHTTTSNVQAWLKLGNSPKTMFFLKIWWYHSCCPMFMSYVVSQCSSTSKLHISTTSKWPDMNEVDFKSKFKNLLSISYFIRLKALRPKISLVLFTNVCYTISEMTRIHKLFVFELQDELDQNILIFDAFSKQQFWLSTTTENQIYQTIQNLGTNLRFELILKHVCSC